MKEMVKMTLNDLYKDCEYKGIEVYPFNLNSSIKGLALPDGYIAIDVDKIENSIEELEIIAHEESHIETGSFYNIYSPYDIKAKHERKAEKATIKKLVPMNELFEAIDNGITEQWELAELFGVSCKFMCKAMNFYKDKYNQSKNFTPLGDIL